MKFIGGGGLGDAVMIYCKLQAYLEKHGAQDYTLTHVEVPDILLPHIKQFYDSMDVPSNVMKIPGWDWLPGHINEYDVYLDTSWHSGDRSGFEIKPFPTLPVSEGINSYDYCIAPFAGRNLDRKMSQASIAKFIDGHKDSRIVLIGHTADDVRSSFDGLGAVNMINQTDVRQAIDIIMSSSAIISNIGFTALFSGCAKKKVFSIPIDPDNTAKYVHPDWDFNLISNILDIV